MHKIEFTPGDPDVEFGDMMTAKMFERPSDLMLASDDDSDEDDEDEDSDDDEEEDDDDSDDEDE